MVENDAAGRFTFNAYDVFANFLPGGILLAGISTLFVSEPTVLPELTIIQGILLFFLAFAIGVATQSIGSWLFRASLRNITTERATPFDDIISKIRQLDECKNDDVQLSPLERKFANQVKNDLPDVYKDESECFKLLLAYLESSSRNRTLRLQALHLATRGLFVATAVLSILYLGVIVSLFNPVEPLIIYDGYLGVAEFLILATVTGILSFVFYIRAKHFEDDVVRYMMAEYQLERARKYDVI